MSKCKVSLLEFLFHFTFFFSDICKASLYFRTNDTVYVELKYDILCSLSIFGIILA